MGKFILSINWFEQIRNHFIKFAIIIYGSPLKENYICTSTKHKSAARNAYRFYCCSAENTAEPSAYFNFSFSFRYSASPVATSASISAAPKRGRNDTSSIINWFLLLRPSFVATLRGPQRRLGEILCVLNSKNEKARETVSVRPEEIELGWADGVD